MPQQPGDRFDRVRSKILELLERKVNSAECFNGTGFILNDQNNGIATRYSKLALSSYRARFFAQTMARDLAGKQSAGLSTNWIVEIS